MNVSVPIVRQIATYLLINCLSLLRLIAYSALPTGWASQADVLTLLAIATLTGPDANTMASIAAPWEIDAIQDIQTATGLVGRLLSQNLSNLSLYTLWAVR